MDEDSLLDALTAKLRLNTAEDGAHRIHHHQQYDEDVNMSDGDISMKDYTEDDIDIPQYKYTTNHNFGSNHLNFNAGSKSNQRVVEFKERKCVEEPKEEKLKIREDAVRDESRSLIKTLLQPERQGYMFGVSMSQKKKKSNDDANINEDSMLDQDQQDLDLKDQQRGRMNRTEMGNNETSHPVQKLYGKYEDRNVIIHNHFYNIITSENGNNGNTYMENLDLDNCESNGNRVFYNNSPNYDDLEDYRPNSNYQHQRRVFENLKNVINYSILISFTALILIRLFKDIGIEYQKLIIRESFEQEQCMNEYYVNRCDEYGQLPALKGECLEWKICFSSGNTVHFKSVFYSELCMQVIGRLINETLNNIGGKNKMFLMIVLIVWYVGNFVCGYARSQEQNQGSYLQRRQQVKREHGIQEGVKDSRGSGNNEMIVRPRKIGVSLFGR